MHGSDASFPSGGMEDSDRSRFVQLLGAYPDVYQTNASGQVGLDIGAVDALRKMLVDFARVCRRDLSSADFLTEAYG